MKNKIILFSVLLAPLFFFNSCRKGEEDPAISLRSRDARLTGTWTLTNYEGTATDLVYDEQTDDYIQIHYTFSYSGTTLYENIFSPYYDERRAYLYTLNMTINKNGTMAMSLTNRATGTTSFEEYTDSWFWLNAGKNKSKIHMGAFRGFMGMGEFDVVRLSNRELKLRSRYSSQVTYSVWNDRADEDITYTFVKQ